MNIERYHPERVKYVVWSFEKGTEINIDSDDLNYSQLGKHHHGLQCSHYGGTKEHELIQSKLLEITKLFRQIDELNNKNALLKNG